MNLIDWALMPFINVTWYLAILYYIFIIVMGVYATLGIAFALRGFYYLLKMCIIVTNILIEIIAALILLPNDNNHDIENKEVK